MLMNRDKLNAATAAARVDYESACQLSRVSKRSFGTSFGHEAATMRTAVSLPPSGLAGEEWTG
jgi:hypothetical protein